MARPLLVLVVLIAAESLTDEQEQALGNGLDVVGPKGRLKVLTQAAPTPLRFCGCG